MITRSKPERLAAAAMIRNSSTVFRAPWGRTLMASGGTPRRFSTRRFTVVSPISGLRPRLDRAASSGPMAARVSHTSGAQPALYSAAASIARKGTCPPISTIAPARARGSSTISHGPTCSTPHSVSPARAATSNAKTRTARASRRGRGLSVMAPLFAQCLGRLGRTSSAPRLLTGHEPSESFMTLLRNILKSPPLFRARRRDVSDEVAHDRHVDRENQQSRHRGAPRELVQLQGDEGSGDEHREVFRPALPQQQAD